MADEDAAMEGASGGTTPGTAAPPPVPVPVARPTTLTASRDLVLVDCAVEGRVLRCSNGHVYKVIKTLRECIYGKVRVATVCRLFNDGLYHETQELVALKIMSKVSAVRWLGCFPQAPHAMFTGPHSAETSSRWFPALGEPYR